MTDSFLNKSQLSRNPEEKEIRPKHSSYFTPKTTKSYDI